MFRTVTFAPMMVAAGTAWAAPMPHHDMATPAQHSILVQTEQADLPKTGPGCPSAGTRSPLTTQRTNATFLNRKGFPLKLYWIDTLGKWQARGEIAPNGSQITSSFVGHRWVLLDADGRCVGAPIVVKGNLTYPF